MRQHTKNASAGAPKEAQAAGAKQTAGAEQGNASAGAPKEAQTAGAEQGNASAGAPKGAQIDEPGLPVQRVTN
jgi:hypothetical protein